MRLGSPPSVLLVIFSLAACSTPAGDSPRGSQASVNLQDSRPTLLHLQMRDQIVTVHGGSHAMTYTVRSVSEPARAQHLTLSQLRAEHPEAAEALSSGCARPAPYLDATAHEAVHVRYPAEPTSLTRSR